MREPWVDTEARARRLPSPSTPPKKRSTRRQTVQAAGWVKKSVSAKIDRIAKHAGLTRSRTIATLLGEAVHQRLHVQHAVLLKPLIKETLAEERRKDRAQFAAFLVRIAFDTNTNRHLLGNILGRQPGVTPESLNKIRDWCTRKAMESIKTRSPEIEALIRAVDQWFEAGEGSRDGA